jgi:hypothetical protein
MQGEEEESFWDLASFPAPINKSMSRKKSTIDLASTHYYY